MKLDKVYVIGLIMLLSLALVLFSLLALKAALYRPRVDTGVPFTDEVSSSESYADESSHDLSAETNDSSTDYVRNKERFLFLVVGVDRAAGLADAIMLVSFDITEGSISVMQIPRDTYIEADGAGKKINALLPERGVYGIRDILERTLCINIDYTALIDLDSLEMIVDAVGGVEIDVPFDMKYSDPFQELYIDIKAGTQLLDGKNAVDFIRYRAEYADGDLGRIDAQKQFLSSLFHKVINELNAVRALSIARGILPMLETDLIIDDAAYFAGKFFSLRERSLTMLTAPGFQLHKTAPEAWYYVLSREGTLEAVNSYFNVYDSHVTDDIFDPLLALCKEEDDDFLRIYKYSMLPPRPIEG